MDSNMAQKTWEMSNNVETVQSVDDLYKYNKKQQQDILTAKPWEKEYVEIFFVIDPRLLPLANPHCSAHLSDNHFFANCTPQPPTYFKDMKVSALALLKMVMHARSGGTLEVMGLLLGKVDANTMIVMDSFALPVEGTETRVNAQAQAYEYMADYTENAKTVGRLENMLNQQFQEPFVAIVIDPVRTISAGKVNLGAFRTYPKGYKPPPDEGPAEYQTIPLNKIEDFGVHCKQYYSLEVSYFKSSLDRRLLDSLWNKYWVNTLSSSSLLTNAEYTTGQVFDLSDKLEQSESQLGRGGFVLGLDPHEKRTEDKLAKATRDSCKTTIEVIHGLMSQVIKDRLFNQVNCTPPEQQ
ncbi:hypothetical protein MTO96_039046 [Rhipicephalus appendiculatus]